MNIAFDIDGTWSLDPILFNGVARAFVMSGHRAFIITGRDPANSPITPEDKDRLLIPSDVPVLYSKGELKEVFAKRNGIIIDVWVDNEPGTIQPQKLLISPTNDEDL